MAGKQDLKTAMQDFWMLSQLVIVENLSVLLPAPELHLFFEIGALQWASGSLAYIYTQRDILVIGLVFEII